MNADNTIQKQVDLIHYTVMQTLHTTEEKDMAVSALIFSTSNTLKSPAIEKYRNCTFYLQKYSESIDIRQGPSPAVLF